MQWSMLPQLKQCLKTRASFYWGQKTDRCTPYKDYSGGLVGSSQSSSRIHWSTRLNTYHNLQFFPDTVSHKLTPDSGFHFNVMQSQLQWNDDKWHCDGGHAFNGKFLPVSLLSGGGTAESWIVYQLHPHLRRKRGGSDSVHYLGKLQARKGVPEQIYISFRLSP